MTKRDIAKRIIRKATVKSKNPEQYLVNKYTKNELRMIEKRTIKGASAIERDNKTVFISDIKRLAKQELQHNDYIHNLQLEGIYKTFKGYVDMFIDDLEMGYMLDGYEIIYDSNITYKQK